MKKDKNLFWKFKLIFLKYLFISISILSGIGIILYLFIRILIDYHEPINFGVGVIVNGMLYILSSFYITIPVSILIFLIINYNYTRNMTDKELKKLDESDIFFNELIYFIHTFMLTNMCSILKYIKNGIGVFYDEYGNLIPAEIVFQNFGWIHGILGLILLMYFVLILGTTIYKSYEE